MAEREWNGEMPQRMRELPLDAVGRPVPWFVSWIDGKPEFRVADGEKLRRALRVSLCWVCGKGFSGGEDRAWLIGPMCAVNLVTSEPPSHLDCAVWSARNCPFLGTPNMVRRDRHMPEGAENPAGIMIRRNPGASVVWVTTYRGWKAMRGGAATCSASVPPGAPCGSRKAARRPGPRCSRRSTPGCRSCGRWPTKTGRRRSPNLSGCTLRHWLTCLRRPREPSARP